MRLLREHAQQRGIRVTHLEGSYGYEDGAALTRSLLTGENRPTALVLGNDLMAVAARPRRDGSRHQGARGPLDPRLGRLATLRAGEPGITAVDQQTMERGRMAADLLFRIAAGESGLHWETPPGVLRVRDSTGPAGN